MVIGTQSGVGTSDISLYWHSNEECGTVNPEQRLELYDWRITNSTIQGGPNSQKWKIGKENDNGKGNFKKGR